MTDDVYVFKSASKRGWLKIGHSLDEEDRRGDGATWLPDLQIVAVFPGGGKPLEDWFHDELRADGVECERHLSGRWSEWFRCDLRTVELTLSRGARHGIELAARTVITRKAKGLEQRLIAEKTAERQKQLAAWEAAHNYSREETETARKAAQPVYEPKRSQPLKVNSREETEAARKAKQSRYVPKIRVSSPRVVK